MTFAFILIPALVLLICLINAEKTSSPKKILLYKTPLSLLFILAWGLQPAQNALFSRMVLTALLFCLAGDILLAFPSRSAFFAGLVSFFGAVFFYLSDIFVARERFIVSTHVNRAVGLPLYYTAQFLLAFSAAWIPG